MFIKTSHKRFPNLCRYVEQATARRGATPEQIGGITLLGVGVLSLPAAIILGFLGNWVAGALVLAGGLFAAFRGWVTLRNAEARRDRLSVDAAEANVLLNEAIRRGRLHKVSGHATTTLLEECARQWVRTHQALESPFWSSPNLPLHYQGVREQSARAADRAMDEAVVLMRQEMALPTNEGFAEKIGVPELLEGVFGVKLPATPMDASLPIAYQPVRHLAEKLRELAENVEALTLEVAQDPSVRGEFKADSALDLCITELRSIRQAETELRQNFEPEEPLRQNLGG